MTRSVIIILVITNIYEVTSFPSHYKIPKDVAHTPVVIHHDVEHNTIPQVTRKKKGPTIPYQIIVPNLHVIPLSNVQHQIHEYNNANIQTGAQMISHGNANVTQQLIPVLIPFHNYVPVHDLTVIPIHRVQAERKVAYRVSEEEDGFRNPLGGYGVGWTFGGHGAGHGFHYSYYG